MSRDQVSHPYRTIGKIIVVYILIFLFLIADEKTKDSGLNGSKHYPNSVCSQFYPESNFVTVIPKYLNCATFSKELLDIFMS
jgi:hypothetical protein